MPAIDFTVRASDGEPPNQHPEERPDAIRRSNTKDRRQLALLRRRMFPFVLMFPEKIVLVQQPSGRVVRHKIHEYDVEAELDDIEKGRVVDW